MNQDFHLIKNYYSRSISPENPIGEKGKGAMEEPKPGSAGDVVGKGWKSRPFVTIEAGEVCTIADIATEGEIKTMWFAGGIDYGIIIRFYWDDEAVPAIECPITHFFLYGWTKLFIPDKWNAGPGYWINSAGMAVNPNRGFNCFLPMPFRKRAKITLENRTKVSRDIYYQINYEEKKLPLEAGYLHTQFSFSLPVMNQQVHTVLDNVCGNGIYIGTALYVGLNRTSRWWGEGEFKFYLDGDQEYPSICGTGLEDYFGGAYNWDMEGEYKPYTSLYSGMNWIKPGGLYEIQQRFSMYRWHFPDPIRFYKNIKVTVQDLGWQQNEFGKWDKYMQREDDFISVAYFYLDSPQGIKRDLIDHRILQNKL